MAVLITGMTREYLNGLLQAGLDPFAARRADDPAWVPLAVVSEGATSGFIAYVVGEDGDPYYLILLTVGAGSAAPVKPGAAIDDLLQRLVREARQGLTL